MKSNMRSRAYKYESDCSTDDDLDVIVVKKKKSTKRNLALKYYGLNSSDSSIETDTTANCSESTLLSTATRRSSKYSSDDEDDDDTAIKVEKKKKDVVVYEEPVRARRKSLATNKKQKQVTTPASNIETSNNKKKTESPSLEAKSKKDTTDKKDCQIQDRNERKQKNDSKVKLDYQRRTSVILPSTKNKKTKENDNKTNVSSPQQAAPANKKIEEEQEPPSSPKKGNPLITFFNLLNLEVHGDVQRISSFEVAVCDIIERHPKVCSNKYPFKAFMRETRNESISIYPLPLMCAIKSISLDTLKLCYKYNTFALKSNDSIYGTPLHYACRFHDDQSILEFMIKEMAYEDLLPSIFNSRDRRSPLHLACLNPAIPLPMLEYIIEKTPLKIRLAKDKNGMNCLHLACSAKPKPRYDIIECLLRTIFNPLVSSSASTPVINGDCGINDQPTDVYTCCSERTNKQGLTPVHIAIMNNADSSIVQLLLRRNPKVLETSSNSGQLPIHAAMQKLESCFSDSTTSVNNKDNQWDGSTKSPYNNTLSTIRILIAKYPQGLSIPDGVSNEIPQDVAGRITLPESVIKMLTPIRWKRPINSPNQKQ